MQRRFNSVSEFDAASARVLSDLGRLPPRDRLASNRPLGETSVPDHAERSVTDVLLRSWDLSDHIYQTCMPALQGRALACLA